MTTKEMALKTIERLPADVSWEDIQERINFVAAVRKGFRELDDGKGIPHDKVKEESAEWFTVQDKGGRAHYRDREGLACC